MSQLKDQTAADVTTIIASSADLISAFDTTTDYGFTQVNSINEL